MRICIICSGFSDERGVSINSGKSIYEILENYTYITSLEVVFIDDNKDFFLLKKEFLFSNTVEDFIHAYKEGDKLQDYIYYLKTFDKVFLTTHGAFGEDGGLQKILEDNQITYVGHSSYTSQITFLKLDTLKILWENNICKKWLSQLYINEEQVSTLLKQFGTLCIKPNNGGSSIGVQICCSLEDSLSHIQLLKSRNYTPLIEEVHKGIEFSICLINEKASDPTEIVNEGVFTYEKKYFPSNKVIYRHPAHFPKKINEQIKRESEQIYKLFKCGAFLRVDGFYNPENNQVIYTDLNTIPGFQTNGFFFKHKSHFDVIEELLQLPKQPESPRKKNIYVIFGGDSSEQNVSIISGTNVIINLSKYPNYNVIGCLLYKNKVWLLDYEECFQTSIGDFLHIIKNKKSLSIREFIEEVKKNKGTIFNGLHGDIGENGTLQKYLEDSHVAYTGSNSEISKLCMDKHKTALLLKSLTGKLIKKHLYILEEYFLKSFRTYDIRSLEYLFVKKFCIKPNDDGCSVGVSILKSFEEFVNYQKAVQSGATELHGLPLSLNSKDYLLQEYIETDFIKSEKSKVIKVTKTGWFEGTIGTLGKKVLVPSVCLSTNQLLTMAEKFLQGTGTNLTPIPRSIGSEKDMDIIRSVIKQVVINHLKLHTYCRVDYFYNVNTKQVIIIEINTLPALTPATVLFQQVIYFNLTPRLFLKKILQLVNKTS